MSDTTTATGTNESSMNAARTPWRRHVETEPIEIRDPLAELLGMVPEGEPLVVTFTDVAKAAGHACPAVAGAYRGTQLALEALYPETHPIRSEIAVTIGGPPDEPGLGPMSNVVSQITGAADETGFGGFGGYGERKNLLTYEDTSGSSRSFSFTRTDSNDTIRVSFDPTATGVNPTEGGGQPAEIIPQIISGDVQKAEREEFLDQWHERVRRILTASAEDNSPFSLERL